MIIGVTGYGATGASACMDLIKEFDGVQYYKPHVEFQLLQQPDGIIDLHYNLVESRRRISINAAIVRFIKRFEYKRSDRLSKKTNGQYVSLSRDYINSLIKVCWKGKSSYDPQDILSRFEDTKYRYLRGVMKRIVWLFNPNSVWPKYNNRYYACVSEKEFVHKTRVYLDKIFKASGFDTKNPILLEQLFGLEKPTEGAEYFDDFRSIIVDRDPRDVYAMTNGYLSQQETSFMPNKGDVKAFVKYFKGLHHSHVNHPNVMYINFEDLIYKYDESLARLKDFLKLDHVNPKEFFKPEWSINNTRTYKNYPELKEDIKYIERELKDYLYPFSDCENNLSFVPENTGVFDAKPGDNRDLIKRSQRVLKMRTKNSK